MNAHRLLLALLLVAIVPATAQAQTPTPAPPAPAPAPVPPAPPPVPAPAPAPVKGKATIAVSGGLATKKMRYAAPFQQLVVRGRVKPYVAGEKVTLVVLRRGKTTKRISRAVKAGGRYRFKLQIKMTGRFRVVVKHGGSPAQLRFKSRSKRVTVGDWQAGAGARGTSTLLLQRGLAKLGYSVPVSGYFDALTSNAVTAFRKVNRMGAGGYASKAVYAKVMRGQGAFKLRYPKSGKHVEFDWSRQVLVLAQKGRPYRVYHTSSGTPATPTVFGTFKFYLQTPGTNAKEMVHSSYFIRGYAIHGYASVPNYPASHGCLRVPIPNAASIFNWIDIGDTIYSYR